MMFFLQYIPFNGELRREINQHEFSDKTHQSTHYVIFLESGISSSWSLIMGWIDKNISKCHMRHYSRCVNKADDDDDDVTMDCKG